MHMCTATALFSFLASFEFASYFLCCSNTAGSVGCECVVFVAGRVSSSFWCYKRMPNFNKHFFFFLDHTFKMN